MLHSDPEEAGQAKLRIRHLIDFAAAVSSPLVTVGSFRGQLTSIRSGGHERLAAILHDTAIYAELHGIRLAIEPLNRYEADVILNAEEGLAFVDEVGHPAFGLLLDTYHVNIEESSWTEPFQRVMATGRLWHMHIGDNNCCAPSYGLIDFPAIVATLHEVGYNGYLSAELLSKPNPDIAAAKTLNYMNSLLNAVLSNEKELM